MKRLIKKIVKAFENLQIQPSTYHILSIVIAIINTVLAIVKLFN